jgi:putative Mg2+ transporter-C (MgtC) family protein
MNEWDVIARAAAALFAGGAIGLERSFHGRAAGLRTYALVSFGSALLVAAAQYEFTSDVHGNGEVTRVIQGIVTGIGFLGAGVIIKEGFAVRGLTTAASIWVAAAIGVVIGGGLYLTGAEATVMTLVALATLRHLEDRLPAQSYVHVEVAFGRSTTTNEAMFRKLIEQYGFEMGELSYRLYGEPSRLEYRAVIWTSRPEAIKALETTLLAHPEVVEFSLTPTHD